LPHELPEFLDQDLVKGRHAPAKAATSVSGSLSPDPGSNAAEYAHWNRATICAINFCEMLTGRYAHSLEIRYHSLTRCCEIGGSAIGKLVPGAGKNGLANAPSRPLRMRLWRAPSWVFRADRDMDGQGCAAGLKINVNRSKGLYRGLVKIPVPLKLRRRAGRIMTEPLSMLALSPTLLAGGAGSRNTTAIS